MLRNEGEERENAEGGITGIKGRLKIILRLNLTIQMMIKRNITDFGIIGYKYRSVNCNEKRGRKENRIGSDLWFKMENQGRGGTIIYHQYDKRQN